MSSNNGNSFFTFFAGLVAGAIGGGLTALLYAPMSGEEMRTQISTKAQAEYDRAVAEYHKQVENLDQELTTLRAQINKQDEQIEEIEETVEEE